MKNKTKNLIFLFFITLIFPINKIWTQQFVTPTNEWFIDDICYGGGNTYIDTYSYSFSNQEIEIGGLLYRELMSNSPDPIGVNGEGKYYREEDGKVYLLPNEDSEEYLIYDFNLELDDELTLGDGSFGDPLVMKVLSIDSIALNSGELRKRIELEFLPDLGTTATWIEGVGSLIAPLNTLFMVQYDCWTAIDCYWKDEEIDYQIGGCELGNFDNITISTEEIEQKKEITIYPNPSSETINLVNPDDLPIQEIEIYHISGKLIKSLPMPSNQEINVSILNSGIYFLSLQFKDGTNRKIKFIKE